MFNKILVPLDGSSLSEQALPIAVKLARVSQGELLLLRMPVFETSPVPALGGYGAVWPEQSIEHSRAEARDYLKIQQRQIDAPDIKIRMLIVEGDVAGAILDIAKDEQVDLIVMSTHGYSGVTRWVMGSVTERVLSNAPCPVYVVRSPDLPQRILITLDGSDVAELALQPGLEVGAMVNANVTLLSAVREIDTNVFREIDQVETGMAQRLREDYAREADDYLNAVMKRSHRADLKLEVVTTWEPAAQSILDYVDHHDIDLIVMATHGRKGLSRWVYGSVTEKVLRGAKRSLLVVRPSQT